MIEPMPNLPIGTAQQVIAANPESSVWVGANAGTGKTHVLTDRITRLLLNGASPGRILCITFTNAAAAEMATRLSERLGRWSTATDETLRKELERLLNKPFTGDLDQARRLFATCLEFPGGLKIQTIHAFAQSILARFPLEAGLAPNQRVMDERTANELLIEARDYIFAHADGHSDLKIAVSKIAMLVDEQGFQDVLTELTDNRAKFEALYRKHASSANIGVALRERLGLKTGDTEARLIAEARRNLDTEPLQEAADLLLKGGKRDQEIGQKIADFLSHPEESVARFPSFCEAFLVKKLTDVREKMMSVKISKARPDLEAVLYEEQARISHTMSRLRLLRVAEATEALLVIAKGLIDNYQRLKRQRGLLDYDDLILATLDLLQSDGGASWVLYKLDGGLDHILVDEAQDTSAEQWAIVEALASEFFSDAQQQHGERLKRTLFVVGDEKQSIYAFQGADPEGFTRMQEVFARRFKNHDDQLKEIELALSFRSTQTIINAVDKVFTMPEARDGLTGIDKPVRHKSNRHDQAGLVELWPPAIKDEKQEDDPWDMPMDRLDSKSPEAQVADRIAVTIRRWLDTEEPLPSRGRPIAPGDILILVQKRGQFAARMVRALKDRDIPVAGADRMALGDQLVVKDLLAAAEFALLPQDDLTLACVLKSPLIGMGEDDLFDLAYDRPGTLWQALRNKESETCKKATDRLHKILNLADRVPPYEFFEALLIDHAGERDLLSVLGPDAADPIDELLTAALNFEREHPPSLQGFLHWIRAGSSIIKRDLEQNQNEVRVMTVHGSKGLQGDIVFLADSCREPVSKKSEPVIWAKNSNDQPIVYWPVIKENLVGPLATDGNTIKAMRLREYRRLLYVAMTRARDRLYVTGWHGDKGLVDGCWYDLLSRALKNDLSEKNTPEGSVLRMHSAQSGPPDGAERAQKQHIEHPEIPNWPQTTPLETLSLTLPLLAPLTDEEVPVMGPFDRDDPSRFKRGQLIHRLLQTLPDLDAKDRQKRGYALLRSHGVTVSDAKTWLAETMAIIDDPEFGPLFGPGSLAEVPIVGVVEGQVISARLDRLVVLKHKVMIVDYKTNRPAPKDPSLIPDVYRQQLSGYRALISAVYSDRPIETALLWTEEPRWMIVNAG